MAAWTTRQPTRNSGNRESPLAPAGKSAEDASGRMSPCRCQELRRGIFQSTLRMFPVGVASNPMRSHPRTSVADISLLFQRIVPLLRTARVIWQSSSAGVVKRIREPLSDEVDAFTGRCNTQVPSPYNPAALLFFHRYKLPGFHSTSAQRRPSNFRPLSLAIKRRSWIASGSESRLVHRKAQQHRSARAEYPRKKSPRGKTPRQQ